MADGHHRSHRSDKHHGEKSGGSHSSRVASSKSGDKASHHHGTHSKSGGTSMAQASTSRAPGGRRRTRIPDKLNQGFNLWAILKNSIGKDLSKIAMPVNVNEPLSLLQRLTEEFEYSNVLDVAANCTDNYEQMAYVAAFTVSPYASTAHRTGKPFNPLLGETYECDRRSDFGWYSISEQVSHHPPIAALHCVGREWVCWQDFSMDSKFRAGTVQIVPLGSAHLTFNKSGNHYVWRKVTTTVRNIIFGKLKIEQSGEMNIINYTTKDKCRLSFLTNGFGRDGANKVIGEVIDSRGNVRWTLNGNWDSHMSGVRNVAIERDGNPKLLWKMKPPPPNSERMYGFTELAIQLNEPEEGVAPTDSRNRPDQRLMENGFWNEANKRKVGLEEKQRAARRKLEAEQAKAKKAGRQIPDWEPVWFKKQREQVTGETMHLYGGKYWEAKSHQDWSKCPDIF